MGEAVIVSAVRTAVGKAHKGSLAHTRIEEIGKAALEAAVARVPGLSKEEAEDVIIGCSIPEGEQGFNFARIMALHAGFPVTVPAMTSIVSARRVCSPSRWPPSASSPAAPT